MHVVKINDKPNPRRSSSTSLLAHWSCQYRCVGDFEDLEMIVVEEIIKPIAVRP